MIQQLSSNHWLRWSKASKASCSMAFCMTWTSMMSCGSRNTIAQLTKDKGTSSGAGLPDRSHMAKMCVRDASAKQPSFVITTSEFEFAMGLFEKMTDEKCPYLRLDISGLPPLSEYESSFASASLTHSFFTSFQIPSYCRDSAHLSQLARIFYPY